MMQVPNVTTEYAQVGWFQHPAGDSAGRTRTVFWETNGSPDSAVLGARVDWESAYNIPIEQDYYSVQMRRGLRDNLPPIDPGNGLNRYLFYRNGSLVGSPGALEAILNLSQGDVAGEIHGPLVNGQYQASTSQMPGTTAMPATFADIHLYYNDSWQDQGLPDGSQNDDLNDWGSIASFNNLQIWDKSC
jgi:hypothetical protein